MAETRSSKNTNWNSQPQMILPTSGYSQTQRWGNYNSNWQQPQQVGAICAYHSRFGGRARQCIAPCTFASTENAPFQGNGPRAPSRY
jgi:hypothetical protein